MTTTDPIDEDGGSGKAKRLVTNGDEDTHSTSPETDTSSILEDILSAPKISDEETRRTYSDVVRGVKKQ